MLNLANTYSALGRADEALEMRRETLYFYWDALPENHPDIGECYAGRYVRGKHCIVCVIFVRCAGTAYLNLANSYSDLGRHVEALWMREKTLEHYQRVHPENHPSIGMGKLVCGRATARVIIVTYFL
jgi:hypothetical protein